MTEIEQLLERQARWQQSRAHLPWAEKLRLAEALRDAALAFGWGNREKPERKPPLEPDASSGSH